MKSATRLFHRRSLLSWLVIVAVASMLHRWPDRAGAGPALRRSGAGRGLVTEPGLHFKIPFIENVVLLDKRILDVETPKQEVLAADNTPARSRFFPALPDRRSAEILSDGRRCRTRRRATRLYPQLGSAPGSRRRQPHPDRQRRARSPDGRDPRAGESADGQARRRRRRCAHPACRPAAADFRKSVQPHAKRMGAPGRAYIARRAPSRRRRSPPRPIATRWS